MIDKNIERIIENARKTYADKTLRKLDLSNCGLNSAKLNEIIEYLKKIEFKPTHINLDCNQIRDDGLINLLSFSSEIEEINLDRNNITNLGVSSLLTMKEDSLTSTKLKLINLNRNNLKSIHANGSILELINKSLIFGIDIQVEIGNIMITKEEIRKIREMKNGVQSSLKETISISEIDSKYNVDDLKQSIQDLKQTIKSRPPFI